jgi:hypothetical protein
MPPRAVPLLLLPCAWLASCQLPPALPAGFAALAREAPPDEPLRLRCWGTQIVAVAVPLGPGGLPGPVRVTADAIAPGGRTLFAGREWGPRGPGYRIERMLDHGGAEHFRSVLLDAEGAVLERSHSLPVPEVPPAVLLAVTAGERTQVRRVEVVSGPSVEEGYRATVADRAGRTFMVECDLQGRVTSVARALQTSALIW